MSFLSPLMLPFAPLLRIPFLLIALLATRTLAQSGPSGWTAAPFNPPALPLAVRSPYLNTWVAQGNKPAALNNLWSNLWTIGGITGWYGSVVVDDIAYRILGLAAITNTTAANQTAVEFTPTQTSFLYTAGPMEINVTFISPIEPTDLVRQSMPFSYLSMSASSTDGNAHTLRMYSDISGEFIAGDTTQVAQWSADDDGQYTVLNMALQSQRKYTETNQFAQDATEFYAFKKISGTTSSWAITEDVVNRAMAANGSTLLNKADPTPRPVQNNWPVLGIAVDWGSIKSTPEPAVWALGVMRGPSIQYKTAANIVQERYPYFMSAYADGPTATKAFLDDFSRAQSAAQAFDAQLSAAANEFTSDYVDLLALSARQSLGALDITIAKSGSGSWNTSDVKVFMKNMGGVGSDAVGTTLSVNTVDTLYAAFPMFMYLNPELGGYALSPLLEYQDSAAYTLSYAARNIGSAYPNATADGINDAHDYGIEETANMLIMTLAYSQRSGNGTFLSTHYTLLRKWADYLVNNTLTPTNQKSADFTSSSEIPNNNQTNIALKGIIGIACMAEIANIAKVSSDQEQYNKTATTYISQWEANAVPSDNSHIEFFYDQADTNGLIYNMYADQLLKLNLVSDTVYEVATVFYNNIASQATYGLPLDNDDAERTTTNWMMFAASTVTNSATQDFMISQLHQYASSSRNNTPFSSVYNPSTGVAVGSANSGQNSPASGGLFSLLAVNTTIQSNINLPSEGSTIPGGSPSTSSKSNAGAIAGGVIGGLIGLGLIAFGIFYFNRRRRNLQAQDMYDTRAKPATGLTISPSVYSSSGPGSGKMPGFNEGATFEPFRYSDAMNGSHPNAGDYPYPETSPGTSSFLSPPLEASNAAVYGSSGAQNVRDSTYFRTHHPGDSEDIGPSASQVGSSTSRGTGSGRGSSSGRGGSSRGRAGSHSDGTAPQQVMLAKQTLVNEELRSEVDNLRRDLERIREERVASGGLHDEAPPSYDAPI